MTKRTKKTKIPVQYSLMDAVIESIQDIKGEEIVVLDLTKISDAAVDQFIICHADNTTQVRAIAQNVVEMVKEKTGIAPFNKEGFKNAEWILIDYLDVVVHVFYREKRLFYQLEELWGDAHLKKVASA